MFNLGFTKARGSDSCMYVLAEYSNFPNLSPTVHETYGLGIILTIISHYFPNI